jgi:hypothetical protein
MEHMLGRFGDRRLEKGGHWLNLPSCLASSNKPILLLIIFWSLVIIGVLLQRRRWAFRHPGQFRARPRLTLRPYDTKCTIKSQLGPACQSP